MLKIWDLVGDAGWGKQLNPLDFHLVVFQHFTVLHITTTSRDTKYLFSRLISAYLVSIIYSHPSTPSACPWLCIPSQNVKTNTKQTSTFIPIFRPKRRFK